MHAQRSRPVGCWPATRFEPLSYLTQSCSTLSCGCTCCTARSWRVRSGRRILTTQRYAQGFL
eukprot:12563229-Alexandrium_andersonii.AAC.1